MAQSGCLPVGSLLTKVRRQSATYHRRGGPPVLRQSAQRHQFAKAVQAIAKSPCNHGRWFTVRIQVSRSVAFPRLKSLAHSPCLRHVRHNSIQSHKGGLAHATVKHHSPSRHGRLVLLGRSLSPQPNFAVNGTPTSLLASARPCGRPLPLALGFGSPI